MAVSQQKRPRRPRAVPVEEPIPWYKRAQNIIVLVAAVIAGAATLLANITTIKTSWSELFGDKPAQAPAAMVPAYTPSPSQISPSNMPVETPSKAPFFPPEAPSKFAK